MQEEILIELKILNWQINKLRRKYVDKIPYESDEYMRTKLLRNIQKNNYD